MKAVRYLVTWTETCCAVATIKPDGLSPEEQKERARALVFDEIEPVGNERVRRFEPEPQGDTIVDEPWRGLGSCLDILEGPLD